ncbi:MurR/RpiR family transcriptional regulator [Wansuia hejianensis]|uniref:MurR/RpiR family transcriptional regulator n=1 Tax=Wansuia hejianensis TaxID=2763667 RepID=A0A926IMK9_9FIRM|nr:MurR/RpiR family transcriptional regulator [Wansuia hejianensis]MBC8590550.1 MurR/RpiR family transcriptional regulator [Wansuia hejianensis]
MNRNLDLIELIQNSYPKFSKGHKIIANYIINNYDKAAFMTAVALGEATGVSESTVVRFAIRLGYDGYRELQNDLQELIKNKLTTVQRLHLADNKYGDNKDFVPKIMERDMDNIKKIINEFDFSSFEKAIDIILKSNQIYILGLRSSAFLAGYLSFYLNFLFSNIKLVSPGPNDIFEQFLNITSDDVIIIITYPRYSKRIIDVLEYAKEKGTKIITITDSFNSPAAQKADVALIASSDMLSFVDSLVAPMSLINAFIIALGIEKKDNLNNYFEDLEEIWKKYGIYNDDSLEY